MVRIRLDFGYDGADFAGWASQPNLRTVQGELEAGLGKILRVGQTPQNDIGEAGLLRLAVAGRTDAGVHARGQVAHVQIPNHIWDELPGRSNRTPQVALVERLTAVLPPDIVVNTATEVADDFDARFSATTRRYSYHISDSPLTRDPLSRNYIVHWRNTLDVNLMDQAARQLVGLHDFAAFCKPRPNATTIRRLLTFAWRRPQSGVDQGLVVATIRADAFCHHMVRALVGAVIKVGEHKQPVTWPLQLLQNRAVLNTTIAPAHGLTLEEVTYPPPRFQAERALRIRAKRTL